MDHYLNKKIMDNSLETVSCLDSITKSFSNATAPLSTCIILEQDFFHSKGYEANKATFTMTPLFDY